MASLFLSYAREDAKTAQRIAGSLEAAGHRVWWDRHVHAGSRFSSEIDAALKGADLIIVLWSKASVESPWVQDEASAGRDSGRLIPVLIDRIEPPLGFRQYQAVDLGKRRAGGSAQALLSAVADRLGEASRPAALPDRKRFRPTRWVIASVAAALLALAGGALWLLGPFSEKQAHDVVISAPAGANSASNALARTIALDLASFKVGPLAAVQIQPSQARHRGGYRAEVSLSGAGPRELALSLTSPQDKLLWSATVTSDGSETDLRQQGAAELGAVLACAFDPKVTPYRLNLESFSIYLDGCAKMGGASGDDPETIQQFRALTGREPKFGPGWARLAQLEFQALVVAPGREKEEHSFRARFAQQKAMEIDPTLPQLFIVKAFLTPVEPGFQARALGVLESGLRANPDDPGLHQARAQMLIGLGRTNEALGSAKQAVALDPLSSNLFRDYVFALVYAGREGQAEQELARAERRWPNSSAIKELRYSYYLRFGDARRGLRELELGEGIARDQLASQFDDRWKLYLVARADRTEANVDRAIAAFRDQYERGRGGMLAYIMALGTFGRVEEAYRVMLSPAHIDDEVLNSDIFFRPFMRSVRADPRFMQLADKLGLLDYWRKSDVWPDFCNDADLPYDCRKEAAKVRGRAA